jgi:hypothetical protein
MPRSESVEPGLVGARQRQRQQAPGRLGAHRREVGEIDGQAAPADVGGIEPRRKMHALQAGVDGLHEVHAWRRAQHCRIVIAGPDQHIVAPAGRRSDQAGNESELAAAHCLPRYHRGAISRTIGPSVASA